MANEAWISNRHIRLKQCRLGPMLYVANDRYIGQSLDRYGEFSQGELELLGQLLQPGQVVLDVGANIGTHTVFFAQTVGATGAVYAFEPQRVLFQILCGNVALNALANVHAYQSAVGRASGTVRVPLLDYDRFGNFGGLSLSDQTQGEAVSMVTIDQLDLAVCHLIKIDVEGMEGEVISGAEQTLQRLRPMLYLENDRPERSAALIEQLLGLDYRLYWHLPQLFNPNNYFGATENLFPGIISANMLGLHRSVPQNVTLREIGSPADSWREGDAQP